MSPARKRSVKKAGARPAKKSAKPAVSKSAQPADAATDALSARAIAKADKRGRTARRQAHLAARFGQVNSVALESAMRTVLLEHEPTEAPVARSPQRRKAAGRAMAVAGSDRNRWVPIGPSVVRRGQADGRPRVSGRIRDLQVDSTGQRAYAASGKGGVWYTEDGGTSWRPIGGWASSPGRVGGASTDMSCGCLLVSFGADASDDYVMVGTGDQPSETRSPFTLPVFPTLGGRGVLAGRRPATLDQSRVPFEAQTGIATGLENTAIARLVRDPARTTHAQVAVVGDRVLAATTGGLYLGTRRVDGSGTPEWRWTRVTGLDPVATFVDAAGNLIPAPICDVQWVPVVGVPNGRIYIAIAGFRVGWSDALGAAGSWNWLNFAAPAVAPLPSIDGRLTLSPLLGTRLYILLSTSTIPGGSGNASHQPYLYRIPDATVVGGPASAVLVSGVPDALWSDSNAQREWDQALTCERVGAVDRVWLGGSAIVPYAGADYGAALYCFDVNEAGANAPSLTPAPGVSRLGDPPGGDGANMVGLIGNNVHGDVHCVRIVSLVDGSKHVWVGCDGGVYRSERAGRVNTFAPRSTGLAVLEGIFLANHPSSTHFCAIGSQDNGSQVRSGDTVWELIQLGDGGGQMFHPVRSDIIISQYTFGTWNAAAGDRFVDPLGRRKGGGGSTSTEAAFGSTSFYSGCDAVGPVSGLSRIAIGTNRVWISDDLGVAALNSWKVLPFSLQAPAVAVDARSADPENAANLRIGIYQPPPAAPPPVPPEPYAGFGAVQQLRWCGVRRLYAVYTGGVVRFDDDGAGNWLTTVLLPSALAGTPNPATITVTDLAPVALTRDFYFTTLGDANTTAASATDTLWFFQARDPAVPGSVDSCTATGLRLRLPPDDRSAPVLAPAVGPRDPAHSVVVDPDNANVVYVGTTGGAWRGVRNPVAGTWAFDPFMNGLPVTCVADMRIVGKAATAPKLLRAATRSRGVWEVLLDAVDEPPRTFLRVHARDDRRKLPTPMDDPRKRPGREAPAYASPDIVVRPAPRAAAAPALRFPLATGDSIGPEKSGSTHLWTFQTAFRWLFPSIMADGQWSDALGDLVRAFRQANGLGNDITIDAATWNAVVGGTRLSATRAVTNLPTDAWAVLQPPWQTAAASPVIPTEADVLELVQPLSSAMNVCRVHREAAMVDVLLHHRDTRALTANDAYAALYWRAGQSLDALLALRASAFAPVHTWQGVGNAPAVAAWNSASGVARLNAPLDAFMPKAVSIPLDLADLSIVGPYVALVAVCGSPAEAAPAPTGLPPSATIVDLVRRWPRAALRVVELSGRRRTVAP